MGQIQQALSKLITTSVVTTAGVKTAEETLTKKNSVKSPEMQETPEENEELSMDQIYGQLLSTGATATDISKGFTQFRKSQREDFKKRLEESKNKKEGEK